MTDGWLIDKSALWRVGHSVDGEEWIARIERGLVRITTVTILEMGYSARNREEWHQYVAQPPVSQMPRALVAPAAEHRAVDVQELLAARGEHRAPSIPDLLIAAVAEIEGLRLLHLDKDFELIAEVTGQPVERLQLT